MEMTGKLFKTWERETYGNDRDVFHHMVTRDIMEMTGMLFRVINLNEFLLKGCQQKPDDYTYLPF